MDNAHISRKYCDAGFVVIECFFHGHCWRATLLGHVWFGLHGYCSVARPIGLAQSVVISNGSLTGLCRIGRDRRSFYEFTGMAGQGNCGFSSAVEHVAYNRGGVGLVVDMAGKATLVDQPFRRKNLAQLVTQTAAQPGSLMVAFVAGYGVGLTALRLVVFSFVGGHVYFRCVARSLGDGHVCIGRWIGTDGCAMVMVSLGKFQTFASDSVA